MDKRVIDLQARDGIGPSYTKVHHYFSSVSALIIELCFTEYPIYGQYIFLYIYMRPPMAKTTQNLHPDRQQLDNTCCWY